MKFPSSLVNMKCTVCSVCVLSMLLVSVTAAPFTASASLQVGGASSNTSSTAAANPLTSILSNVDLPGLLGGVNSFVKLVGVFCPPLSQVLDNVIQNVTSTAFRVFGRIILQSGGLGGGSNGGGGGGGQKVNVVLPTFPPDDDDEDYEDEEESTNQATTPKENDSGVTAFTSSADDESNAIAKRHVRVIREAEAEAEAEEDDQDGAESAPQPNQDLATLEDDQDRNKRFLPFGGSVDAHAHGGGSGNFLFDIIRLVAGSGATEEGDEKEHAPGGVAEVDIQKDGYTEGIPGPITRLFVIANRGVANLVQDLILRLAQTSEKLVNFKARLVTALI